MLPFVGRQLEDGHAVVKVTAHGVAVERVLRRPADGRVVHVGSHQHAQPLAIAPVPTQHCTHLDKNKKNGHNV